MSRYTIVTDNENLEIILGFDEGLSGFFLTIEDVTKSDGEPESFLFHNMVHHPGVGMTFEEMERALVGFGIHLPEELAGTLVLEAGADRLGTLSQLSPVTRVNPGVVIQVFRWERVD
jgi:hypothetical protein